MAEVIRPALDEHLSEEGDASAALSSTFGAAPDTSARTGVSRGGRNRTRTCDLCRVKAAL